MTGRRKSAAARPTVATTGVPRFGV
jgi:hypothetical protein